MKLPIQALMQEPIQVPTLARPPLRSHLGRLVQRRGDGMATVLADLHVLDRVLVHLRLLKQLARLQRRRGAAKAGNMHA
eukprot:363348-Chlamydomonas_euryale.AAC.14